MGPNPLQGNTALSPGRTTPTSRPDEVKTWEWWGNYQEAIDQLDGMVNEFLATLTADEVSISRSDIVDNSGVCTVSTTILYTS